MTSSNRTIGPARGLLISALVVGVGAAAAVAAVRDRVAPRQTVREAVLYVPSPAVLDRMALSYDTLLADVYWIRALQHFGGARRRAPGERDFALLYPLLNITTALDPKFDIAYRFGAIFLSERPPGGPGRADQAVELLQRGLRARPTHWRYMQDIGFVYYWSMRDYEKAAEWFERGANVPGAPFWMRSLAANTRAAGGNRAVARALWQSLLESADDDWLRGDATWRLQQLDAMDAIDRLQLVVDDWMPRAERPYSWQSLIAAGRLRGVPVDPAGVPYYLGPYTGTVELGDDSPLHPLPTENLPGKP